jgi:hypothetical protein
MQQPEADSIAGSAPPAASRLPPRLLPHVRCVMTCLFVARQLTADARLLLLVLVCLLPRGAAQDLQLHSRVSRFPFHVRLPVYQSARHMARSIGRYISHDVVFDQT